MNSSLTNTANLTPLYTLLKTQPVGVLPVHSKNRNNPIKNGHGKLETVAIFMFYTPLSVDLTAPLIITCVSINALTCTIVTSCISTVFSAMKLVIAFPSLLRFLK